MRETGIFICMTGLAIISFKKDGLNSAAKCHYAQFVKEIVVCNGVDDFLVY